MTLLARGQAALNRRMQVAAGVDVTYTRSAVDTDLDGVSWVGRTVFASNLEGGARIEFGERDYLIPVADLPYSEPALGDRITETIGGSDVVFEVATPTTGDPAWRYSDQSRTVWRIHCKRWTASVPINTTPPAISGTALVGQTLSSDTGTWTGTPTAYAYQWYRDGVAIAAATIATYVLVDADTDADVTVLVTATNASGSVSETSASVTVAWDPSALGSAVAVWLTAGPTWCFTDASGTVAAGNGDQIQSWRDRSGNLYLFTQTTAGDRPILRLTGSTYYADFASSDYVSHATGGASLLRAAHTVVYAIRHDTDGGIVVAHNSGGSDPAYGGRTPGRLALYRDGANVDSSNLSFTTGEDFVATFRSAGVSGGNITSSVWKNGTAGAADLTQAASDNKTGLRIGTGATGGDALDGRVYGLVLCSSELSNANRARLETYHDSLLP